MNHAIEGALEKDPTKRLKDASALLQMWKGEMSPGDTTGAFPIRRTGPWSAEILQEAQSLSSSDSLEMAPPQSDPTWMGDGLGLAAEEPMAPVSQGTYMPEGTLHSGDSHLDPAPVGGPTLGPLETDESLAPHSSMVSISEAPKRGMLFGVLAASGGLAAVGIGLGVVGIAGLAIVIWQMSPSELPPPQVTQIMVPIDKGEKVEAKAGDNAVSATTVSTQTVPPKSQTRTSTVNVTNARTGPEPEGDEPGRDELKLAKDLAVADETKDDGTVKEDVVTINDDVEATEVPLEGSGKGDGSVVDDGPGTDDGVAEADIIKVQPIDPVSRLPADLDANLTPDWQRRMQNLNKYESDTEAIGALSKVIQSDPRSDVRRKAWNIVRARWLRGGLGHAREHEKITAWLAMSNAPADLRRDALGLLGDKAIESPAILSCLADGDVTIRRAAATATQLWASHNPHGRARCKSALEAQATKESDERLKRRMTEIARKI
jgi:hypothetical protein